jgi:hypothetical protein
MGALDNMPGWNKRMGRRSQGVKMDLFVACVNQRSGTEFFGTTPRD